MKKIIIHTLLVTALFGCTKIINVDLQNATQLIVIEGTVTNAAHAQVIITRSVPFSSSNNFPAVTNAVVTISDNGSNYELTETMAGTYTNKSLIGTPGHTYYLTVSAEGKEYTSSSTMPQTVNLDTLLLEKITWGNESNWTVIPQYTDPAGFGDNYMFIETINGKRFPQVWVWDDRYLNDAANTLPLIQSDSTINVNDTIEIEMRRIDKNIYRYFASLISTQENETTPANPESQLNGGALGYFSAHTSQKKKVKVQ